jgi:hypothetical protein
MVMTSEQVLQQFDQMTNTMTELAKTLGAMQERYEGGAGGKGKSKGEKKEGRRIEGKMIETFKKFSGGEVEWNAWAEDFKIMVDTRSEQMGAALEYVRGMGKVDKEVVGWRELRLLMHETGEAVGLDDLEEEDCGRLSKELYRAIHLTTDDEAKLVVKSVEDGDGLRAWGKLHARFNQRTLTRMMRLQQECMYPKVAKVGEMASAVLAWEGKWKRMENEQAGDIKIPPIWKMAAMLKICPKEIADMVELRWDEIGEEYEKLKDRVIGWATTKAEKKGGPVPMDVDRIDERNEEDDGGWGEDIDAVYPTTKCYYCQGYGHMARECPMKGKGKGR